MDIEQACGLECEWERCFRAEGSLFEGPVVCRSVSLQN